MKNYFLSEKTMNQILINFKDVKAYERIWNYNNSDFDRIEIDIGSRVIILQDVGSSDKHSISVEVLEEAERFYKEYMEWLDVQK